MNPSALSPAKTILLVLSVLAVVFACSHAPPVYTNVALPAAVVAAHTIHYQKDVQPIFDAKCAACHSCNDAPCQLKLTSADGVTRGASKQEIYDGTRPKDIEPTRLGIDALSIEAWRQKGFFSAIYSPKDSGTPPLQASLLYSMVELGHQHPWAPDSRIPDGIDLTRTRSNQCPVMAEFDDYAKNRPLLGMPFAMSGLTDQEMQTLRTWIAEGGTVDPPQIHASEGELQAVEKWERYLNRPGPRERLVARYLYEHLFLAHLYFPDEKQTHFFELLRSHTPPGQELIPVTSATPNDEPGGPFYYRLRLITETIVHKTHIIYPLDDKKLDRFNSLFFGTDWAVVAEPGYAAADRANPFATFAAIPARARYEFMLDNAEYFVRTFIRGPVCSGQVATDVIRDQFWVLFENPATERYVNDAAYRQRATPLIGLPGQDSDLIAIHEQWEQYREQRNRYVTLRQAEYARTQPKGPGLKDLWDGGGWNRNALLTVFRHFDNASVEFGLIGNVPETLWVMDYPLLERTYYQLVVNFNVFGGVAHQLDTRLYFDLIRNEGEYDFLRFLPRHDREKLRSAWYADSGKIKLFTTYAAADDSVPTRIVYKTSDSKSEFAAKVFARMHKIMGPPDLINRCALDDCQAPGETAAMRRSDKALRPFASKSGAELPVIKVMPELVYLRIVAPNGERLVYSLVHNRAHTNVAFLVGEDLRLEPDKDTLTVMPGITGSYPNFIFDVPLEDVERFTAALAAVQDEDQLHTVAQTWGLRRTRPDFWPVFHDLTTYLEAANPTEGGLLDLGRYGNL